MSAAGVLVFDGTPSRTGGPATSKTTVVVMDGTEDDQHLIWASGPSGVSAGTVQELVEAALQPHVESPSPHPNAVFDHVMSAAQTTAVVDHNLERDPVAVQVFDEFGVLCDGYGVVFTLPGRQVRLSFDVPIQARIRLT